MANTSTPKPKDILDEALKSIPSNFRKHILKTYRDLKTRHNEAKYDASGLSAGKFCESVFRFLQHHLTAVHVPFGRATPNFTDECAKLIGLPKTTGNESLRVVIPRTLIFVYTLRNKRGIGHVGGDVDANRLDSQVVSTACDWVVCELIRVFHNLSLEEAQDLVDSVSTRQIPDIWEIGGRKRVLREDLDFKDKTLLLLYSSIDQGALVEDLFLWTKYSNAHMFKRAVLEPLDKKCLVDYDPLTDFVILSPLGIKRVEDVIMKQGI